MVGVVPLSKKDVGVWYKGKGDHVRMQEMVSVVRLQEAIQGLLDCFEPDGVDECVFSEREVQEIIKKWLGGIQ